MKMTMRGLAPMTPLRFLSLLLCFVITDSVSHAEIIRGHDLKLTRQAVEASGVPFDPSDFLRLCMESTEPQTFLLGEPVPLRFRLVNHTKNIIVLNLVLDLRTGLDVRIGDGRRPARRYNGPYGPGAYPPLELKLYPLEERPFQVFLWGDLDAPTGMAFPEPGQYSIEFKIRVKVANAAIEADMYPLDPITLAPEKKWMINVRAPSPEESPLVEELKSSKAISELHARHLPGEDVEKFKQLIEKYPATPLTPHITFVLGLHLNFVSLSETADTSLRTQASQYLQMAALADSAIKAEAWEALIYLYDGWGLTQPAQDAIRRYVQANPPQLAPMIGNMTLVRKYFPNSTEMDPSEYWDLLN